MRWLLAAWVLGCVLAAGADGSALVDDQALETLQSHQSFSEIESDVQSMDEAGALPEGRSSARDENRISGSARYYAHQTPNCLHFSMPPRSMIRCPETLAAVPTNVPPRVATPASRAGGRSVLAHRTRATFLRVRNERSLSIRVPDENCCY